MTISKKPTRILFICLGNIVRSPLAEALFIRYASEENLDGLFTVDSAGTSRGHVGEMPDDRMLRVASLHGLSYTHQARQIKPTDLDDFDLLITMDRDNYSDVLALAKNSGQQRKVHMLREWDPHGGEFSSVPDPYYGGKEGFNEVYQVIDRSVQNLVGKLKDAYS